MAAQQDSSRIVSDRDSNSLWTSGVTSSSFSDDRAQPRQQSPTESKALDDEDDGDDLQELASPITLNVGGTHYTTSLATLSRIPESVLSKMFNGGFSRKPEKDGSWFIDRDGPTFRFILNYLRDGVLLVPTADSVWLLRQLLMESKYYHIPQLISLLSIKVQSCTRVSDEQIHGVLSFVDAVNREHNYQLAMGRELRHLGSFSTCGGLLHSTQGLKRILFVARFSRALVAVYFPERLRKGDYQAKAFMCVITGPTKVAKCIGVHSVCAKGWISLQRPRWDCPIRIKDRQTPLILVQLNRESRNWYLTLYNLNQLSTSYEEYFSTRHRRNTIDSFFAAADESIELYHIK